MKRKIAILGSTGSIGKTLLKIIDKDKKNFEIVLLTGGKNYKELIKQSKKYKVKNIILTNQNSFDKIKEINKNKKLNIYNDFKNLNKIFNNKLDYVMSSITGLDGLNPTLKIIKFTKTIAIANKESIICGWNLIHKELVKNKTNFIPVDSEHFSIWYSLKNNQISNINKIYLTASGGPLLNVPLFKLENIKIKNVLKHPNWKMGKKISVDSATMMNKVFEIIEARNIFNLELKKLSILIHPKSYIHAIVNFNDGMIKIIAHETTMEIPIINSIYKNQDLSFNPKKLDLKKLNNLNFSKVNKIKYPIVKILNQLSNNISLYETVIVSANDELVRLYLNKKIKYKNIAQRLIKFINLSKFKKLKSIPPKSVSEIIKLDQYVRLKINSKSV